MRAVQYSEAGGSWAVQDVPDPRPSDGESLVDLAYASINPIDLTLWRGVSGVNAPAPRLPHIPGIEGAGWLDGNPVIVFGRGVGVIRDGTIAERCAAPSGAIIPIPAGISLKVAAACSAVGATTMRLLELGAPGPDDRVLVLGASGSIGTLLMESLARRGIQAVGQVRRPATALALGGTASHVVAADPETLMRELGDFSPTVAFDPLGGGWAGALVAKLASGGRIISYASATGRVDLDIHTFYRKGLTLRGYSGTAEPAEHRRCIDEAMQAVLDGRLKLEPHLRVFALDQAPEALGAIIQGEAGKFIIDLG